ncbi:hypothetical protein [Actinocorallia libanotica]|uniref:EthD domain-containing protein n=1 Tax=Actinocorallia libanotica TaxID=46162 RepID=A0ABN1Q330_9ACTN
MERGIFYVASHPASPEREAEFNTWYEKVHMPEVCALPGFVSARRYAPLKAGDPYVALYEIEGADLDAVVNGMFEFAAGGGFTLSDSVRANPAPEMRTLRFSASHGE